MNGDFTYKDGVSLKEHFSELTGAICKANDLRFNELEEKTDLRFQLLQVAIDKAETANNFRLDNMNEWRGESKDRMLTYLSKNEYDVRHQLLENKIENLQKIIYTLLGGLALLEIALKFIIK